MKHLLILGSLLIISIFFSKEYLSPNKEDNFDIKIKSGLTTPLKTEKTGNI